MTYLTNFYIRFSFDVICDYDR